MKECKEISREFEGMDLNRPVLCKWCGYTGHKRKKCEKFFKVKKNLTRHYYISIIKELNEVEHEGFAAACAFPYIFHNNAYYALMCYEPKKGKESKLDFLGGCRDNPNETVCTVVSRELKEETNDLLLPETWRDSIGINGELVNNRPAFWDWKSKKVIVAIPFPESEFDFPDRANPELKVLHNKTPADVKDGYGEIEEVVWIPLKELHLDKWTSKMHYYVEEQIKIMRRYTINWRFFIENLKQGGKEGRNRSDKTCSQ